MGEWTGKWTGRFGKKCKCECGKENGAERVEQCFDAEHIDAMIHDGETRVVIFYSCEECKNKYGSSREIYK